MVDQMTKVADFLPVKTSYNVAKYAQLYLEEVVRLQGIPLSIISERVTQFTSHFWKAFQEALGTHMDLNIAFPPQTYGQLERTIQILVDMLRACILDFKGSWKKYFPLVKFAYNNSYQASTQMTPFEALYGKGCRSPLG